MADVFAQLRFASLQKHTRFVNLSLKHHAMSLSYKIYFVLKDKLTLKFIDSELLQQRLNYYIVMIHIELINTQIQIELMCLSFYDEISFIGLIPCLSLSLTLSFHLDLNHSVCVSYFLFVPILFKYFYLCLSDCFYVSSLFICM